MSKPKHTPQRLADLRPNTTVNCIACEQPRPTAGAVRFHAHWVCASCTLRLQKTSTPNTTQPRSTT